MEPHSNLFYEQSKQNYDVWLKKHDNSIYNNFILLP
jgi:hypothetical protein